MENLFADIMKANQGLMGRVQGISYGIVATNDDPLGMARVQLIDASKGGKSTTDWAYRILPFFGFSPPVPKPGETVLMGYIDGDPHKAVYFGTVTNLVNPPLGDLSNLVISLGSLTVTMTPQGGLDITGATSVSINGKQVATIDAGTDDGKVVTKGWG